MKRDIANLVINHNAWLIKNFDDLDPRNFVLGIVEEWGEYLNSLDEEDIKDSLCDLLFYVMSLCKSLSIDYPDNFEIGEGEVDTVEIILGKISHSLLKMNQGIRGSSEKHLEDLKSNIYSLVYTIVTIYFKSYSAYLTSMLEVWEVVGKRSWKEFPYNGVSK